MRLVHYSEHLVERVYAVEQPVMPPRDFGPKPKGLWLSDEDDYGWREWCADNDFGDDRLKIAHEVTIATDARVLTITSAHGLDAFTDLYGAPVDDRRFAYWIDWPAVAQVHQGILITPYIYARRMAPEATWYYPWDCASGCIWDPAAIASIKAVTEVPS